MDENDAISVVENLIETAKDGEKGYRDAADHVKRVDLQTYFNEQSAERGLFARELHSELAKLGKPEKKVSGSAGAAVRRAWIDTKVALGGGDKTILESVEAGEDNAKDTYNEALSGTLPASLTEIVRRQALSVQRAHDKVKMLRDEAKAA
ncbi:MAG TPA: PA2169 family four-helix-bundle protein [Candidatus Sulfotelmatobacter sp.]|nr:PA2169 family four-helix-bundle protein [Candidatus Sulfotelmatobacter sp.]